MSEDIADLPRLLNQPRRLSVSPLSIVRSFVRSGSLPNLASFHLFSFPSRRPFLRRSSIVFYHASIFSSFAAFLSLFSTTLPRIFPSLPLCVRVSTCTWVYVIYKCSISFSFSFSPPSLPSLCLRSLLERQPSAKEDGINAHGRLEKKKNATWVWIVSIRSSLFRARATTSTVTLRVHQASSLNELLFVYLLFVHPFHMPRDVHLLLRPINTVRALELGLLPALPLLMISQATLQLVHPSARRTIETLRIRRAGTEPFAQSAARPPHDRRDAPSLPGSRPL